MSNYNNLTSHANNRSTSILTTEELSACQDGANGNTYDVIVIGGGIAGLAAANYLISNQKRVLLLEASNRIGGRILSLPLFDHAIDLGASWIHGIKDNIIAKIASELNLQTIPTIYQSQHLTNKFYSIELFDSEGKKFSSSQILQLIQLTERFIDYINNTSINSNPNKSMKEALCFFCKYHSLTRNDSVNLKYMVRAVYSYEYGEDLGKLSVNVEQPYANSKTAGEDVIFPLGYSQILAQFQKKPKILLDRKVIKINYEKKDVITVTNHEKFLSKQVIISVPLGILKANLIEFIPQLPDLKKLAIIKLGFGILNKIYLIFDQVFWDKDSEWISYIPIAKDINKSIEIMNYYKFIKLPILLIFVAGNLAKTLETWSNEKIINYFTDILKTLYNNKTEKPTSYYITRWYKNLNQRGSYAHLPPSVPTNIFQTLARPVANKLFFAGEATSITDPATVHGAYLSGIEAAKQILLLE